MEKKQGKTADDDFFALANKGVPKTPTTDDLPKVEKSIKNASPPKIFEEPYKDDEKEEPEPEKPEEEPQDDEDEDFDFDFSVYESDEEEVEQIPESILKSEPPLVSGLKSRFSHGSFEFERLGELKKQCSSYAIKVAAYKQDISMLREYYGILRTMWMIIKPIFGKFQWDEFETLSLKCRKVLNGASSSEKIPEEVFETLLSFDAQMQRLMQLSNLGFEVERWGRGSRASKQIIQ